MGCVGAGLGLEAAGPWRFSGPAWLDRPKRPARLLFSLSYFLLTEKILERRKRKRGLGKENAQGVNLLGLTKMCTVHEK